jgi:CP family cyanate transporter-like MFS transporter
MSPSTTHAHPAEAMGLRMAPKKIPGGAMAPQVNSTMTLAVAIACIVLVAVDLRPGIVSVGPMLEQIRSEFAISNTQASLLTAIPNVLMGVLALPTPWLARRFGRNRVILAALAVLGLATLLRAFVETTALLLVTTAGVGAGIAIAGALISGFVKARFPRHVSLLMGLYAMSLGLGGTLAAAVTGPLAALGGGWRLGTGFWALPALTAIAAWLYVADAERRHPAPGDAAAGAAGAASASSASSAALAHPARSPKAWLVAFYFATNNFLFFGLLSWIVPMYREFGASHTATGWVLASFTTTFMLANPLPAMFSKTGDRRRVIGLFAGIALVGISAMAIAPNFMPLVTIAVIAGGIGGSFALGMTLPLDHASTPDEANSWTSFILFIGYVLGALGPLALGLLRDLTGSFHVSVWALVLAATLMLSLAPFLAPKPVPRRT